MERVYLIELSDGIEKSLNNRKLRDIVDNKDIYEYFNINNSEHERSFNITESLLAKLAKENYCTSCIAKKLGRTIDSIRNKADE